MSYALGRTTGFVLLVLTNIYWHTATSQEEPLALTAARHAHVLLGTPLVSAGGALGAAILLAFRWQTKPPAGVDTNPDVEAAALREALARSKEKCSQ
jgi:lysylphosphatidylglycerol synthetase-like protein (DUF2156 family)